MTITLKVITITIAITSALKHPHNESQNPFAWFDVSRASATIRRTRRLLRALGQSGRQIQLCGSESDEPDMLESRSRSLKTRMAS